MPLELSIWRIDSKPQKMEFTPLNLESRLQVLLANDISIADPNLLIIGREVQTGFDKRIDILAINPDGELVVLELKRNKTPRNIIAQVLDYGSWIRTLRNEDIADIFSEYQKKYFPQKTELSIDDAFCLEFNVKEMPDELNESHQLVIVASYLDSSTERIVKYLSDEYDVDINALFFRVFKDNDKEYLARAWLREPGREDIVKTEKLLKKDWNGEYYTSFGVNPSRTWEDAKKYGFLSAGGGSWYSNTLSLLEPGARIWVNIPGIGYVGVGKVIEERVPVEDFIVKHKGKNVPLVSLDVQAKNLTWYVNNPEKAEFLVRVKWLKTVPVEKAIKEKGFFGNQNTVARPKTHKWIHTIKRLKKQFGIDI